jgi:hypothetical protein
VQELLFAGEVERALEQLAAIRGKASESGLSSRQFETWVRDMETLVHLRLAEQENCVLHSGIESCLFPIRRGGIHQSSAGRGWRSRA